MRPLLPCIAMACLLMACSDASVSFPTAHPQQANLAAQSHVTILQINPKTLAGFTTQQGGPKRTALPPVKPVEYRIGAGDVLSIYVFDHPELSVPSAQTASGFLVQADGNLAYPFLKSVPAAGRTVADLRQDMTLGLAKFFTDPQLDIRVTDFKSQRVVVGGEVLHPGTLSLGTTPLTLLEAVNGAGGLDPAADPQAITVRRDGQNYTVDLAAFMAGAVSANNPFLMGGDLVSVPRLKVKEAYILGEIRQPASVDLSKDPISLTQAITRQGGMAQGRADARGVFVFRETGGGMTVYQLDVTSPTGLLLGTRFDLAPRDVVYITTAPLQRWNDTISRLLPTVSAYSATQAIGN
jgi:polysaccharide export outer membrane protein